MPPSNKPGWINWIKCPGRQILLEDLEPGGILHGREDLSAEYLFWGYYLTLPEFHNDSMTH